VGDDGPPRLLEQIREQLPGPEEIVPSGPDRRRSAKGSGPWAASSVLPATGGPGPPPLRGGGSTRNLFPVQVSKRSPRTLRSRRYGGTAETTERAEVTEAGGARAQRPPVAPVAWISPAEPLGSRRHGGMGGRGEDQVRTARRDAETREGKCRAATRPRSSGREENWADQEGLANPSVGRCAFTEGPR